MVVSQKPIDTFVERAREALQEDFLVIGKERVPAFVAWPVMMFLVGVVVTVALLASRMGAFEGALAVEEDTITPPSLIKENSDYVIISPHSLMRGAYKLKDYREARGHTVSVISIGIKTSADQIDAWIENYQASNPQLRYVVLLGDIFLLPSYPMTTLVSGTNTHSDAKYSLKNSDYPDQYLPSLVVGRLPVKNMSEFNSYFQKIGIFENSFNTRNTIVFFGDQPELSYAVNRDIAFAKSLGFDTLLLESPSEDMLYKILNENKDIKIVFFYGHGSWFGNGPILKTNLKKLHNVDYPIIYLTGGCGFGDTGRGFRAFIEDLLVLNKSGVSAAIGTSNDGGYGYAYHFIIDFLKAMKEKRDIGETFTIALRDHAAYALSQPLQGSETMESRMRWVQDFTMRVSLESDPGLVTR